MKYYIYSDDPAARKLRDDLRLQRHTAILCNPEFFTPADVREVDVVIFPKAHRHAQQVQAVAAAPFPKGHPREGQTVTLEWWPLEEQAPTTPKKGGK